MKPGRPVASTAELPPIHELAALEAVARLGSVQAAADALHVTPSGISHRIAGLANHLGLRLLQRKGRGVALTREGADLAHAIRDGLVELARATQGLRQGENEVVRVATAAAVGAAWLLPLLKRRASQPDAPRVELSTVATADELPPYRWDILVHYGRHPRRGSQRRALFADRIVAVRTAAARGRAPGRPILRLSQLAADERQLGLAAPHDTASLVFDDALAMLEAAAAGVGVAIATETAAGPYLTSGRLVRATPVALPGDKYFADLSEAGQRKPAATRLFQWLVQQARARDGDAQADRTAC